MSPPPSGSLLSGCTTPCEIQNAGGFELVRVSASRAAWSDTTRPCLLLCCLLMQRRVLLQASGPRSSNAAARRGDEGSRCHLRRRAPHDSVLPALAAGQRPERHCWADVRRLQGGAGDTIRAPREAPTSPRLTVGMKRDNSQSAPRIMSSSLRRSSR